MDNEKEKKTLPSWYNKEILDLKNTLKTLKYLKKQKEPNQPKALRK